MKLKILVSSIILFTTNAFAQTVSKEQFMEIKKRLPIEKDAAKKADLLYQAATYYVFKEGTFKTDLDSAALYNSRAYKINKELNLKKNITQCMVLNGEIIGQRGNMDKATLLKTKALNYALSNGLKKEGAAVYISMASDVNDSEVAKKTQLFENAISLYRQAGAPTEVAEKYFELARIYNNIDDFAQCIKFIKQAIKIKKSIKKHDLYREYIMLAQNLWAMGNYDSAIPYALEAEKMAENEKADAEWLNHIYNILGILYGELKYYNKSIGYYRKAITSAKKNNNTYSAEGAAVNIAMTLNSIGKNQEALTILNNEVNYYPGKDCNVNFISVYILVYCKLKKTNKARPYYEHLLKCNINDSKIITEQKAAYYAISRYLIDTGQANNSYDYIEKLKRLASANNNIMEYSLSEITHFEADSATGNYIGAIEHYKRYKTLNDTIFNNNSRKQFNNLQLKYETEKKDKSIKLLTEHGKLQDEKIQNATILRYVFIGSLGVLILFVALLYNRSRLKQRTNKKLQLKQQQINEQNDQLKKLLLEKDWLLKEIHHRVKNNLQIVISLLNTQSAYLDNEDALQAIQNSEHRMHAMSIIHQKLYQSDNMASIDMSWYISELVNYLKECFTTNRKIVYKIDNEQLDLDVSQAVPLGLILNEAISNAIKYAFTTKDSGQISISLKNLESDTYQLIIADDGVGLPEGFQSIKRESLGMDMMIGLTDQLDGTFELKSNNGLTIIITFTKK